MVKIIFFFLFKLKTKKKKSEEIEIIFEKLQVITNCESIEEFIEEF